MNKIELTDNELENVLELIITDNQSNGDNQPETIEYWNSIIRKLDPDGKFSTESILDAEEEKNQLIEDKKRKGQLNMGSIVYGGEDGAY